MKVYRFVAKNCYQKYFHGIFRGLNFEKAHIPHREYNKAMKRINTELHCPVIKRSPFKARKDIEFWFTEKGYKAFKNDIESLIELYFYHSPNYIKEWDIVEKEISEEEAKEIYYDEYQVVLKKGEKYA